jgi:signal transduction histidine kinase/ligand-binding sensor domain-containing protein
LAVRRNGSFTTVPSVKPVAVQHLLQDSADRMWVSTYDGLFRSVAGDPSRFEHLEALGDDSIGVVAQAGPQTFLIGTAGRGLKELTDDRVTHVWNAAAGAPGWAIACIAQRDASTWVVGVENEIKLLHGGQLTDYAQGFAAPVSCSNAARASDGTVWWMASRAGVFRFRDQHVAFEAEPWARAVPWMALEDREGDMWISTSNDGIYRLHRGPVVPMGVAEGLPANEIAAIATARDGGLWVGFEGEGVAHVRPARDASLPRVERLGGNRPLREGVKAIAETRDGTAWFGTEAGLFARRPDGTISPRVLAEREIYALLPIDDRLLIGTSSGLFELRHGAPQIRPEIGTVTVNAIARTTNGTVWATAGRTSLHELRPDGTHRVWAKKDGLRSTRIASLWAEGNSLWLVAEDSQGPRLARLKDGELRWLGAANGVPEIEYSALQGDGRGGLWACSGGVLYRMSLAELSEAATRGDQRVRPRRYADRQGMRHGGCGPDMHGAAVLDDGRVVYSTRKAVVLVDPTLPADTTLPPLVAIDEINLDGKLLTPRAEMDTAEGVHRVALRVVAPLYPEPDRLALRFRLQGIDSDWQDLGAEGIATYTDLPPGEFRFTAQAYVDGERAGDPAELLLRVPPRYYQTLWFRGFVAMVAVLFVLAMVRLRIRSLEQQRAALTALVAERTEDLRVKNTALSAALVSLKEAQEERLRTERLASVAVLVRGIAHELSNPLGVISGNLDPLRRYTQFLGDSAAQLAAKFSGAPEDLAKLTRLSAKRDLNYVKDDVARITTDIADSARRAQLIIGDLQRIDAGGSRPVEEVDVVSAVRGALRIFERRVPPHASLRAELPEKLFTHARAGEIEQVVINLLDNALRAIGDNGTVTISAYRSADGIELVVKDDGAGMTEDVRSKATQAFFTTRAPGEGSGLGLAVVSAIAGHHAGSVALESELGNGTSVRVILPSLAADVG